MSVSEPENRNPYLTVALFSYHRADGKLSDEEIAEKLRFDSAEEMRARLESWNLPSWLVGQETAATSGRARPKKGNQERKARSSGPLEEVPNPSAAAGLLNEAIDGLARAIEDLEDFPLGYQERRFGSAYTSEETWVFLRRSFSEQEWRELCERYGRDPNGEGFFVHDEPTWHSLGASPFPPRDIVALLAAYALSDRPIEPLVEALYPEHSQADIEEIKKFLSDTKSGGSRDGLRRTAQQFAAMVYGRKVERGAPTEEPPDKYWLACHITERREVGVSDEEIHQDILS